MAEYKNSNELSHEQRINHQIKELKVDTNQISDGYHTFGELYDHRIQLFIQLAGYVHWQHEERGTGPSPVWRTTTHSDGSVWDGWFILGINQKPGEQITYHLPISKWDECRFAGTVEKAPEWDGHTSADVLERLKTL